MRKRIFWRCLGICLLSLLLCCGFSILLISSIQKNELEKNLFSMMEGTLSKYDLSQNPYGLANTLGAVSGGRRVTIIAPDGIVLGDSQADAKTMENHSDRPEFIQAIQNGRATQIRVSDTTKEELLYAAIKAANGTVLRYTEPISKIAENADRIIPVFIGGIALAAILSLILARAMSSRITRPLDEIAQTISSIGEGGSICEIKSIGYEEIDHITSNVVRLSKRISKTLLELDYEREKSAFILDHMEEGVALIGTDEKVLYINGSAINFLSVEEDVLGKSYYHINRQKPLVTAIEAALKEQSSALFDIPAQDSSGRIFSCRTIPVIFSEGRIQGVILIISDVSELRNTEQMRSEFIANASHELKTPLTSIHGFAELLSGGLVEQGKQAEYLNRITREAERMMGLVNDILQLSKLESNVEITPVCHNLLEEVNTVADHLMPQANEKGVKLNVSGEGGFVMITPEDARNIVQNLIDNAIKYNREGGSVDVKVYKTPRRVILSVSDTGVGIPVQHQGRIFERFYRVDKGRSRKLGGTGLGLSIVKHIALRYSAEISLASQENMGTRITVSFPPCNI